MEFGNLSEIVGAVAVVASVLYLAAQVKKQTEEARLEASRDISSDFIQILLSVSENPDLAEILTKGIRDYEHTTNPDRLRANFYFAAIFRMAEQQHLHTTHGTLDPVYFSSFNRAFLELMSNEGPQQWWAINFTIFSEDFREYVNGITSSEIS